MKQSIANKPAAKCAALRSRPGGGEGEDENRKNAARIAAGGLLFAAGAVLIRTGLPAPALAAFILCAAVSGWDVAFGAVRGLFRRQPPDENLLMSAAAAGAFCIGRWEEGAAVLLLYRIGESLEDAACRRSRRSVEALAALRPDTVHVETPGGFRDTDPAAVLPGDVIVVLPGERVPLDCAILSGNTWADTAALTGEPVPRAAGPGDPLPAGCVNRDGKVTARVERALGDSAVSRIIRLVQQAGARKTRAERFVTKFARRYTPIVLGAALALAVVPPLVLRQPFSGWVYRALIFVVVSCPCALVISVPLGFFSGVGAASSNGVLVKGGGCLETLGKTAGVVFDKTGTLTRGVFGVSAVLPAANFPMTADGLLALAASAEADSRHPIARSLQKAAEAKGLPVSKPGAERELAGEGVIAELGGRRVAVGSEKLMRRVGAFPDGDGRNGSAEPGGSAEPADAGKPAATVVHVAVDGVCAGSVLISDEIRAGAADAVRELKKLGVRHFAMLTGDSPAAAAPVARAAGIPAVRAGLTPAGKLGALRRFAAGVKGPVAFVGDGINDAPVLAGADIGIAMGGAGTDAAVEAADVVVMDDEPARVATAVRVARAVRRTLIENVVFTLGVKGAVLALGAFGLANIWAAMFADTGVMLLAVLNSTRVLVFRRRFAPSGAPKRGIS